MKKQIVSFYFFKFISVLTEISNLILLTILFLYGFSMLSMSYSEIGIIFTLYYYFLPTLLILGLIYFLAIYEKRKKYYLNKLYALILNICVLYFVFYIFKFLEQKLCEVDLMPSYCIKIINSTLSKNESYSYYLSYHWLIYWFMMPIIILVNYCVNNLKGVNNDK